MGKLQGKVAVITGGNSGIGRATAQEFVNEGAFVFITGRRRSELDEVVQQLGENVRGIQGDVSSLADLDRLYEIVQKEQGHIDILFVNAGLGEWAPLDVITEEHFDKTFDVNVKGALFTVQKALPLLRDGSSVILTGSTVGSLGTPAFSVYSATKAAIRNFARTWILDLKERRIRVNVVSPGATETPGFLGLGGTGEQLEQYKAAVTADIPRGRIGEPSEVAKVVGFLASDDSSYVNGIELFVDGGVAQV